MDALSDDMGNLVVVPSTSSEVVEETISLYNEISSICQSVNTFVEETLKRRKLGELASPQGNTLLELKNVTMLKYLMDLVTFATEKCNGNQIEDNPVIDRLIEHRIVIEKIRPLYHKLKYQIDKLVKIANTGVAAPNDPLTLRPNVSNLALDDDEEQAEDEDRDPNDSEMMSGEEDEEKGKRKPKKYVPPKVAPVRYEGDESVQESKRKLLERAKKRAMSSSIIQELRREYDDAPEEVVESSVGRRRQRKELKEQKQYEEEYFTRLNVHKKKKAEAADNFVTMSSLSRDITRFEDISALDVANAEHFNAPKSKKKNASFKTKKGFKKTKFRKFKRK